MPHTQNCECQLLKALEYVHRHCHVLEDFPLIDCVANLLSPQTPLFYVKKINLKKKQSG